MINKRLLGRLLSSTSSGALAALRLTFNSIPLDSRITHARPSLAMVNDSVLDAPAKVLPFDTMTLGQYVSYGVTHSRGTHALFTGRDQMITFAPNNLLLNSAALSTQSVTVSGAWHIISFVGTGSVTLSGAATGTVAGTGANDRVFLRFKPTAGSLTVTVSGSVLNARLSAVTYETSPRAVDDYDTTGSAFYGPRISYDATTGAVEGFYSEDARTNVVLWNRDLTNAVWTKTNVTATKNQTGVDGDANSASLIAATAANGTVLQAITLGSSARYHTAYVKRVTGTGTIQMTMDGGATWTAITVTSAWTRVAIPSQTIANPNVGFRIVTSGDAIAVDLVQNENSNFPSTPIYTEASAVTRSADSAIMSGTNFSSWFNATAGTFVVEFEAPSYLPATRYLLTSVDAAAITQNYCYIYITVGSVRANARVAGVDGTALIAPGTVAADAPVKVAFAFDAAGQKLCRDGGAVQTNANGLPTMTRLHIGSTASDTTHVNAKIKSIRFFNRKFSDAELQAITT